MTSAWAMVFVGILSALGGSTAATTIVRAVADRRPRTISAAASLNDSAISMVQEFQEETRAARLEAAEARREVAEARRELGEVRREAEALAADMRNLRGAIMSPSATLERLRAMVGGSQEFNGHL